MRPKSIARRLCYLIICAGIQGVLSSESAYGQKKECLLKKIKIGGVERKVKVCPSDVKGGGARVACNFPDSGHTDTKGGQWKQICTNESNTGDFSWTYDKEGEEKGVKEIGRCVYVQGQNIMAGPVDFDPNDKEQWLKFRHVVCKCKRKAPDGVTCAELGNECTVHLFDKVANKGTKIKIQFNKDTRKWREVERKEFISLNVPHDSGTIPVDRQPAFYATELRLLATPREIDEMDIRWSPFDGAEPPLPNPVLRVGDSVYIKGLSVTDIISVDSRFTQSSAPGGIELTANSDVLLMRHDVLARVAHPGTTALYYALHVVGAGEFYEDVLNGAPMDFDQLEDMPGYASTAGTLIEEETGACCFRGQTCGDCLPFVTREECGGIFYPDQACENVCANGNCIPTVSEWGLVAMTLVLLAVGTIVLRRRAVAA